MSQVDPQRAQELFEYIKEEELFDGFHIVTPTRPVRLTQTEFPGYTTAEIIAACQLLNEWLCAIWGFVTDRGETPISSIRAMTPWERELRYKLANPKRWNLKRKGQNQRYREKKRVQKEEEIIEELKCFGLEF